MRFARTQLRMRQGLDLPPVRGVLGVKINWFWTEVVERERREKLEMLNFLPTAMYLMAGVPSGVAYEKRAENFQPFQDRMRARITQDMYTTESTRRRLHKKIDEIKARKAEMDQVVAMEDKGFLSNWLAGNA